jgi:putative transposase
MDGRFELDSQLRRDYLCRIEMALRSSDWKLIAYALMDSHIHLSMISGKQTLSEWIHPLNTGFAQAINRKRRQSGRKTLGPVFAERPTSKVYECEVAPNIISYIHNNPCRAGIVTDPAFGHWTSHRAYIGVQKAAAFLDIELGLHLCGFGHSDYDRERFHEFVCARTNRDVETKPISCDAVAPESADGIVASNSTEIAESVMVDPFRESISCEDMTHLVSEHMSVDYDALMSTCRRRDIVAARRLSLLAWEALGRRRVEMARYLKITLPSSASLLNNPTQCEKLRQSVDALLVCCRK